MPDQHASVDRTSNITEKIARNTLFNSIGRFWGMGVSFLLTPYIISQIGIERFGIWSLISVLVGYFGLLDFGVGYAFVKYIAEEEAKESPKAINRIVNTGLLFYLLLGVLVVPAVYLAGDRLLILLKAPKSTHDEVLFVLTVAVFVFFFSNAFSVFEGVITGLQRMEVSNTINMVASLPQIIGTVFLLRLGYGLRGLIVAQAMMFAVSGVLLAWAAFRLLPTLRLDPRYFHWPSFRRLVSYGAKVQVSRLAELAGPQTNKLIVGHFVGLGAVTFYELAARVVRMTKSFVLLGAIVPAASELDAYSNWGALHRLYRQGSKFLVLLVAPLMLFPTFAAPLMILAWMGVDYPQAVLAVRILAIGHFVHLLTGMGTTIVRGIGRPEYETRYAIVLAVMNPGLSLLLALRFGFVGVLMATTTSLILSSLYFFSMFHKMLQLRLWRFVRKTYLLPVAGCALAGMAGQSAVWLVHTTFAPGVESRSIAIALLIIQGLAFVGSYALVVWRTGYLDSGDMQLFRHLVNALLTRLGIDRGQRVVPLTTRELQQDV